MLYEILLGIGGLGLVAQTVLGFSHSEGGGGHGHSHDSGHADHGHLHHDTASWLVLLSPLRLFGFCVGAGAAGMVFQRLTPLPPIVVLTLALLAGWLFYQFVVKSLFRWVMQFASKPALTLVAAEGQEAIADSRFDAKGTGIVQVTVDGQRVRLLATLTGDPQPVAAGEVLTVVAIDLKRNACTVAKR